MSKVNRVHEGVIVDFDGNYQNLKKMRLAKGFDQKQLGETIGFKEDTTISKLENGVMGLDNRSYSLLLLVLDEHPKYKLEQKLKNHGSVVMVAPNSGEEIKQTRKKIKGIVTQEKMAEYLKLTDKQLISKYERSERKPSDQNWTLWLLMIDQHPYYKLKKSDE